MSGGAAYRSQHAKAHRHIWACNACDHKVMEKLISSGPVMQYTCGLDGRKYGNVKSCPYREIGGIITPIGG